ncbi:hypothetical protein [Angustibacter aerolatus]
MASLFDRVAKLARDPRTQQMVNKAAVKAKEVANDPKNRARIEQGRAKVQAEIAKRRGGGSGGTGGPGATPTPGGPAPR